MATTATRIADVIYDAARHHYEAGVEFFSPGLPIPLRIGVTLPAAENIGHQALAKGWCVQPNARSCANGKGHNRSCNNTFGPIATITE